MATGKIDEPAVPVASVKTREGPDPEELTLTRAELGLRAKPVAQRYLEVDRVRPRRVTTKALPSFDGDAAFHFFFRAPKGSFEGVMLSVVHQRLRGTVTTIGLDRETDAEDVLASREKVRARLVG